MKEAIKKKILEAIKTIPRGYVSDLVIKETIRCVLYDFLREKGHCERTENRYGY